MDRLTLDLKQDKERKHIQNILRSAGLLAEPSEAMKALAARGKMNLNQVQAALNRTRGRPLSEIILEQRGPKA